MFRRIGSIVVGLAVALTACDQTPVVLSPTDHADVARRGGVAGTKIGPGVLEAIASSGDASIVVALQSVRFAQPIRNERDLAERLILVAAAQASVLGQVGIGEFENVRRFRAVPGFAAVARSTDAVIRLAADPMVRRIDLDVGGTGGLTGSVPQIGADARHAVGNRGEGVVVAVLDTGVDTGNPDLAGRIVHEACFGFRPSGAFCPDGSDRQTGPGSAEDDAGHGTHVIGIVASAGAVTAPGVAPASDIVALKVMDNCSFAGCFYAFSEIVAALDHIIVNIATLNVRAVNMSLGTGALFGGYCDDATAFTMAGAAAVNALRDLGVITFASSGNNGSGTLMPAPACLRNVVAVGAVNSLDVVAGFSNSNATTEIFAPGVSIRSLARGGGTVAASGTSMASPHAAGCAALLIESGEATTPSTILARLRVSGVQVTDPKNGLTFPRIDCSPPPIVCTPRPIDRIWSNGAPPGTVRLSDVTLSAASFDVEAFLSRRAPASAVRIGPSWETGTPAQSFSILDLNEDGNRDVVVRWSIAALIADGNLGLETEQVQIWGRDPGTGELFCATAAVIVTP